MWSRYIIKKIMFPVMQITFSGGTALVKFTDVLVIKAKSLEESLRILEDHFLDDRANRTNDVV